MNAAYYQQILDHEKNSVENQDLFHEINKANDFLKKEKIALLEKLDEQREKIIQLSEELDFNDPILNRFLDELSILEKELSAMSKVLNRFTPATESKEEPKNADRKNVFKNKFKVQDSKFKD